LKDLIKHLKKRVRHTSLLVCMVLVQELVKYLNTMNDGNNGVDTHGTEPDFSSEKGQLFIRYLKPLFDHINDVCTAHKIPIIVLVDINAEHMYSMQVFEDMEQPIHEILRAVATIIHAAQNNYKIAIIPVDGKQQFPFTSIAGIESTDESDPN